MPKQRRGACDRGDPTVDFFIDFAIRRLLKSVPMDGIHVPAGYRVAVRDLAASTSTQPARARAQDGTWAVISQARARRACGAGCSQGWGRDSGRDVIQAQSASLAFGSLVFKFPESTWSGVVVDESWWVLDVGHDSSFVRKIKATQKMDTRRGVHAVCCECDFEQLAEIAASYTRGRIPTATVVSV